MENKLVKHKDNIFSVKEFWSSSICEELINKANEIRKFPDKELILNQKNLDDNLDSRNSFKALFLNTKLAKSLFKDIRPYLSVIKVINCKVSGIHPEFRIYKYIPGQEFKTHKDGKKVISICEYSIFSLLIYLNDDFKGGETCFENCSILPNKGDAVFFPHDYLHSGKVVTKGSKYVLRANILFKVINKNHRT
jgi:predicted 2-oxoglutarate/Fe(II)-dependent dioxygenase YbiX